MRGQEARGPTKGDFEGSPSVASTREIVSVPDLGVFGMMSSRCVGSSLDNCLFFVCEDVFAIATRLSPISMRETLST